MKSPAVMYLVTRVHGLRTHLIGRDTLMSMVKSKGLPSIIEILLRTDYEAEVSKLPRERMSAAELSRIFEAVLAQRYYYLIKISPKTFRKFIETYARKFEIENIKRALRALIGEVREPSLIPIPREYSYINYRAMLETHSVEEALEFLGATPYSKVLEELPVYKKYGSLMIIDGALDKVYYSEVWKVSDIVPDKKAVKHVVGYEMDLRNIFNIVGLKIHGLTNNVIGEVTLKIGYKLRPDTISSLVSAKLDVIPDLLSSTPYSNIVPELRKAIELRDIHVLRNTILGSIFSEARRAATQYSMNLGFVTAYLLLCEAEARNLVAITTGKELNMTEEEILRLII